MWWPASGAACGRRGEQVQHRREAHAAAQLAASTGSGTVTTAATPVVEESWGRRVAANTRAFADGLGFSERATDLGRFVRAHLAPARWTGIAVGAVVLLFWPAPTLRVLIWIVALVALYLGALEWLQNRAPETTEAAPAPVPGPGDAAATVPANGVPRVADGQAPRATAAAAELVPAPREAAHETLTPELVSSLNDRLGLLVRLGAARDAGVLTDEEFRHEKERLLAL